MSLAVSNATLSTKTNSPYSYNYGRPTEDYRDKFEKGARSVLEEHFEILSLTFHNSKVTSRTDAQDGWTVTPYAYFLLKPKGPEIDAVPPLRIDLDFLDTSGYVVLPYRFRRNTDRCQWQNSSTSLPRPFARYDSRPTRDGEGGNRDP